MIETLDITNLPKLPELSADTPMLELEGALAEAMQLSRAALNTRMRDGQPLTDLAGSYLTRAGGIQLLIATKESGK